MTREITGFHFRYEFIALGISSGQNEQLEYIAKKNKRFARLPNFAQLNTAAVMDKLKFWICNPNDGELSYAFWITTQVHMRTEMRIQIS